MSKDREAYAQQEQLLSPDARASLDVTWATLAKRCAPDMPEAEAIASFKELHAAGLIELVQEGDGVALKMVGN